MNIYTFIKNFMVSDIDNYLTPGNLVSFTGSVGMPDDYLSNFKPTEDGGLIINLKQLASQVNLSPTNSYQCLQIKTKENL
jgi:hypothetical protein